jgi:hypothetical protein
MIPDIHAAIRNRNRATQEVIATVRDFIDHIVGMQAAGSLAAQPGENPRRTLGGRIVGCGVAFRTEFPTEKTTT